jgi:hypothetical protein
MIRKTIGAAILLAMTASASASECVSLRNVDVTRGLTTSPSFFELLGAQFSPEAYRVMQQRRSQAATYQALLAAGAPEPLACAATLNPDLLPAVAGVYMRR